jgi:FAD/FMN-containing dehydrogenase
MLPDGRLTATSAALAYPDRELDTYLANLAKQLPEKIRRQRIAKCASGYNLLAAAEARTGAKRLAALSCGAIGTLGIVTRAVVTGEPVETGHALCVLGYPSAAEATATVSSLLATDPSAIELLNKRCLDLMPQKVVESVIHNARTTNHSARPQQSPGGPSSPGPASATMAPGAILVAEYTGQDAVTRAAQAARVAGAQFEAIWNQAEDAARIEEFWKGRKRMLFSVKKNAGGEGAPSLVNDIGVPVESLSRFVDDVERLVSGFSPSLYIYGHAGSGNLHLRPDVRGLSPKRQIEMARSVYELVLAYDGTVTGEHGMGRLRAPWLRREWGPEAYEAMRWIKTAMDPSQMMNPDVMFTELSFEEMMERAALG